MNVLLVSAHESVQSYNGALRNISFGVLERAGHKMLDSDLYAIHFNPVASQTDFAQHTQSSANYMFEQKRSNNTGHGFSPDIEAEMEKVRAADLIIMQFPLWWGGPPAMMKGWFDRVLSMGFAWDDSHRYDTGLLRGKRVLPVVTVGDPASFYSPEGMHRASVEQHLYGVLHNTLAFCGFSVYRPLIVANTTAASRDELEAVLDTYRGVLEQIDTYDDFVYRPA